MGLNINWRFAQPKDIKVRRYDYNQNLGQFGEGLAKVGTAIQTGRNRNLDEEMAKMMEEENGIISDEALLKNKTQSLAQLDQQEAELKNQLQVLQQELSALENQTYSAPMEGIDGAI